MNSDARPASVIPLRFVESVDAMRSFYIDSLGFEHTMGMIGKDGQLDFAIVQRGGAMLMLSRPQDGRITAGPVEIYVEVEDVDVYHGELAARGVAIIQAPETQWWGDRNFSLADPAGHTIWFWKTVADMQPPPGVTMI
jgi:uncharacterized glyoxalase superfamily protein PhnB